MSVTGEYPCCKCCRWEGCAGPPHQDPCIICAESAPVILADAALRTAICYRAPIGIMIHAPGCACEQSRQDQEKGNRDAR
jgi:hypothetical protein